MDDKGQFVDFMKSISINERTALKLWDNEIYDAKELVSCEVEELKEITKDRTLLNTIFPALKPKALAITMAKDSNAAAFNIIRSLLDEPAPMEHDGIQSDAGPIAGSTPHPSPYQSPAPAPVITPKKPQSNGFATGGNLNNPPKPQMTSTINFLGNTNISQAAIGGSGPVTFDNRGSKTTTITISGAEARKGIVEPSMFKMKGASFMTNDLFLDDGEFWINGVDVTAVTKDVFKNRLKDPDAYPVHSWGKNRALIINNYTFGDKRLERAGAERDTENMKSLLVQLGFKVDIQINKSADQIRQLLHEFTRSKDNMGIGMTMVFIGSHGERTNGKDYFLGTNQGRICVDEVAKYFTEKNCALLKGKPKLFMFQFCRIFKNPAANAVEKYTTSPTQETSVASDASPFMEEEDYMDKPIGILGVAETLVSSDSNPFKSQPDAPSSGGTIAEQDVQPMESDLNNPLFYKDMHFSFATAPGTKSYRDKKDGTWFVTCVVKVFSDKAHKEDYASMLTAVNREVSAKIARENNARENKGIAVQLCQSQPYLDKKVFFYPKGN